jgi:hypothetical protein
MCEVLLINDHAYRYSTVGENVIHQGNDLHSKICNAAIPFISSSE